MLSTLRNAKALRDPVGKVVDSDNGPELRSRALVRILKKNEQVGSMARMASVADNVAIESFHSLLPENIVNI